MAYLSLHTTMTVTCPSRFNKRTSRQLRISIVPDVLPPILSLTLVKDSIRSEVNEYVYGCACDSTNTQLAISNQQSATYGVSSHKAVRPDPWATAVGPKLSPQEVG